MSEKPKRRWFQFGLRTTFILVAVFAMALGWLTSEWRYVRQRQALIYMAIDTVDKNAYQALRDDDEFEYYGERRTVPFWRRWMGDEDAFSLILRQGAKQEMKEADLLFPELKGDWLWMINGWRIKFRTKSIERDAVSELLRPEGEP